MLKIKKCRFLFKECMKYLTAYIFFYLVLFTTNTYSRGSAGAEAIYDSRFIVEMPTAGIIPKSSFSIETKFFEMGGLSIKFDVAPFDGFNMGLSFGGTNVIGEKQVSLQELPGVNLKIRIFDETLYSPAIVLGFDSQGQGYYYKEYNRFKTQSPGLFLSASKSFKWKLGDIATHFGLNYSFEPPNTERALNFYLGIEHSIYNFASLNIEYNANLDDSNKMILEAQGSINAAIRISVTQGITFEIQGIDLLANTKNSTGFSRTIAFEYIGLF